MFLTLKDSTQSVASCSDINAARAASLSAQMSARTRLVLTNEASRKLVGEVTAAVNDTGNLQTGFVAVLAALLLVGVASLRFGKPFFITREETRVADDLAIGERHKGCEPQVNADTLLVCWQLRNVFFNEDTDKVTTGAVFGNGDGRRFCTLRQWARPHNGEWFTLLCQGEQPIAPREGRASVFRRLAGPLFLNRGYLPRPSKKVMNALSR